MPDHHLNAFIMVGSEIFFQVKDGIICFIGKSGEVMYLFMGSWRSPQLSILMS